MRYIFTLLIYILSTIASVAMTFLGVLLSPILPMFVSTSGHLPRWLKWFQTPDNLAWGDEAFGAKEAAGLGMYRRTAMWLLRNPAQGFDSFIAARINLTDTVRVVLGDLDIKEGHAGYGIKGKSGILIITHPKGYFHLTIVIRLGTICMKPEFGWRLRGIAEGKPSEMCKQFVFTPFRFLKFNRG